jgi:hypothetical protein
MDLEQWSKHLVSLLGYRSNIDESNPVIHQMEVQKSSSTVAVRIRPKKICSENCQIQIKLTFASFEIVGFVGNSTLRALIIVSSRSIRS